MSTAGTAVGVGIGAFLLALVVLGRKKSAAAATDDHIEPPPNRPPYTTPPVDPTEKNPVGSFPGVQHLLYYTGPPSDRGEGEGFAGRPPQSVDEAAEINPLTRGPRRLFEGTTATVLRDPSNPLVDTRRYVVRGSRWVEWSSGPEPGWNPVLFRRDENGAWQRVAPTAGWAELALPEVTAQQEAAYPGSPVFWFQAALYQLAPWNKWVLLKTEPWRQSVRSPENPDPISRERGASFGIPRTLRLYYGLDLFDPPLPFRLAVVWGYGYPEQTGIFQVPGPGPFLVDKMNNWAPEPLNK